MLLIAYLRKYAAYLYCSIEPRHEISNNVVCATSRASDQPAHTRILSLCSSLKYFTSVKLLTEHYLKFLSLKGGCTGLSESTLVKLPHCWKSHVMAHYLNLYKAACFPLINHLGVTFLLKFNFNGYLEILGDISILL